MKLLVFKNSSQTIFFKRLLEQNQCRWQPTINNCCIKILEPTYLQDYIEQGKSVFKNLEVQVFGFEQQDEDQEEFTIDSLLDKISNLGINSLTLQEDEFLRNFCE